MHIAVTKRFTFDAAHQLPHHDGKCANMHGHTYVVEVTVSGHVQLSGPSEGMVVDFAKMSAYWKLRFEPLVDHRVLNETLDFLPTAEMLACWLMRGWDHWAQSYEVTLDSVRVWETPTSYAEVRP